MSQQLISHNTDLKRLRDEGYDIEIRSNQLVLKHVPYVNSSKEIKYGVLVSDLTLAGDVTIKPVENHVARFSGEYPCHQDGSEIAKIKHQVVNETLDQGLVLSHSFSSKPVGRYYADYYEKMTTYAAILSTPAFSINSKVTAKVFPIIESDKDNSVFHYFDSATSRACIPMISKKLELTKVGIVGLGGTGSYVLDLISKTPVKEIILFDGDKFSQHNAFRSPGAASIEVLKQEPLKVDYFKGIYSRLHKNITTISEYLDESNLDQLKDLDFIFLCLDKGDTKKQIVVKLEQLDIPFIDVGMGVQIVDDSLCGVVRITTSTPRKRDHITTKNRIPFSDGDLNNEYSRNIQIADLNALNASLAVIKWKKILGFYIDLEGEHYTAYTIDGNHIINEDHL